MARLVLQMYFVALIGWVTFSGHWYIAVMYMLGALNGFTNPFFGGLAAIVFPWARSIGFIEPVAVGLIRFANLLATTNSAWEQSRYVDSPNQKRRAWIAWITGLLGGITGGIILLKIFKMIPGWVWLVLLASAFTPLLVAGGGGRRGGSRSSDPKDQPEAKFIFVKWPLLGKIFGWAAYGAAIGGGVGPAHYLVFTSMMPGASGFQINAMRQMAAMGFNQGAVLVYVSVIFGSVFTLLGAPLDTIIQWFKYEYLGVLLNLPKMESLLHHPSFHAVNMMAAALNGSWVGNYFYEKKFDGNKIRPIMGYAAIGFIAVMVFRDRVHYLHNPLWTLMLMATVMCVARDVVSSYVRNKYQVRLSFDYVAIALLTVMVVWSRADYLNNPLWIVMAAATLAYLVRDAVQTCRRQRIETAITAIPK